MFFASGCAFFIAEKKVLVKMISSRRMGKASSFIENKAKKIKKNQFTKICKINS